MSEALEAPIVEELVEGQNTHGGSRVRTDKTMAEQKAWLLERAKAHRAAHKRAAAQSSDAPAQSSDSAEPPAGLPAPPPPPQPQLPPAPDPAAAVSAPPASSIDTLSEGVTELSLVEELTQAGGDLSALVALAVGESRTELTAALKALGFKGLKKRVALEQQLKSLHR